MVKRLHLSTEADWLTHRHTVADEKSLEFILLYVAPTQFNNDDEHIGFYALFFLFSKFLHASTPHTVGPVGWFLPQALVPSGGGGGGGQVGMLVAPGHLTEPRQSHEGGGGDFGIHIFPPLYLWHSAPRIHYRAPSL
jgi:hypothetical protein